MTNSFVIRISGGIALLVLRVFLPMDPRNNEPIMFSLAFARASL
jgi:hypothetical protein